MIVLLLLLILAAPAAADRERTTIATIPYRSDIATWGGVTVADVPDGDRHRLVVIRDGRAVPLPVEPSDGPLQPDVGPDTRGRPTVVFARDGDLFLHRLGTDGEEPVRTASTPDADESDPSLWRGRIAWVGDRDVLTRNRLLSRSASATRVRGVPRDADEVDVEARGRLIATQARHEAPGYEGYEWLPTEIRLFDVAADRGRRVALQGTGIGGQTLVGLSFAGRWLGWHRTCPGDPSACDDGGARRYDVRSRRHERWTGYRELGDFALLPGGRTLELAPGRRLQRLAAPRWRRDPRG